MLDQMIKDYVDSQVTWTPLTRYVVLKNLIKLSKLVIFGNMSGDELYVKLKKRELNQYTIKQYMILLSNFEKEVIKTNKIEQFLEKKSHAFRNAYQTKTKRLTDEVFAEMLEKAPNKFVYNALILMGKAGLRRAEVHKALWSHFEGNNCLVVKGKGGKIRNIPLSKSTLKEHGFKEITGELSDAFIYRFTSRFGFSPHDLRAYFATKTANIPGLNLNDVASVLGHSSVTTTQRYVRADYDKISKALIGE